MIFQQSGTLRKFELQDTWFFRLPRGALKISGGVFLSMKSAWERAGRNRYGYRLPISLKEMSIVRKSKGVGFGISHTAKSVQTRAGSPESWEEQTTSSRCSLHHLK